MRVFDQIRLAVGRSISECFFKRHKPTSFILALHFSAFDPFRFDLSPMVEDDHQNEHNSMVMLLRYITSR